MHGEGEVTNWGRAMNDMDTMEPPEGALEVVILDSEDLVSAAGAAVVHIAVDMEKSQLEMEGISP